MGRNHAEGIAEPGRQPCASEVELPLPASRQGGEVPTVAPNCLLLINAAVEVVGTDGRQHTTSPAPWHLFWAKSGPGSSTDLYGLYHRDLWNSLSIVG